MVYVTGESVHEPRQRNSPYIQTVIWSIYETRQPEQPQFPTRQYKRRPQGPLLIGTVTWNHARTRPNIYYVYTYVYGPDTPLALQLPRALRCCVKIPPIVVSGI